MNKLAALSLSTTFIAVSASAHADHLARSHNTHRADTTELLLEGAVEFGGDDLATVVFTNGDDETIKAGDGVSIHAGFKHKFNAGTSMLKGTLGYKFHNASDSNSDVGTRSFPLNLSLTQKLEGDWHVSGGLTYQMNTQLDGDGFFQDVQFDDSLGTTFGVGYSFFTLSYTNLDLKINGNEVDASSIGLRFSTAFF